MFPVAHRREDPLVDIRAHDVVRHNEGPFVFRSLDHAIEQQFSQEESETVSSLLCELPHSGSATPRSVAADTVNPHKASVISKVRQRRSFKSQCVKHNHEVGGSLAGIGEVHVSLRLHDYKSIEMFLDSRPIPTGLTFNDSIKRLAAENDRIVFVYSQVGKDNMIIDEHVELRTHLPLAVRDLAGADRKVRW